MAKPLTASQLLAAYAFGYFPMAESRTSRRIRWHAPEMRGVLPLDSFHVPASLRKAMRKNPFEIKTNTAFTHVMTACAEREETWINDELIALYGELNRHGHAHSVECWREEQLVGGLYGVSLGGAFFGESMFSRATNASKVALVNLVERLQAAGYVLLDAQYANDHLTQFGIQEISREIYLSRLEHALTLRPDSAFEAIM